MWKASYHCHTHFITFPYGIVWTSADAEITQFTPIHTDSQRFTAIHTSPSCGSEQVLQSAEKANLRDMANSAGPARDSCGSVDSVGLVQSDNKF